MKWWPDTLFSRLLVAVCTPILIVLLVSYALVSADRRALVRELGGSSDLALRVAALSRAWLPLDAAARAATIAAYNAAIYGGPGHGPPPGVTRPQGGRLPESTARELQRIFDEPVRAQLGGQCAAHVVPDPGLPDGVVDLAAPSRAGPPPGERGPPATGPPRGPPPGREGGGQLHGVSVRCGTGPPLLFRVSVPAGTPGLDTALFWRLGALTLLLAAALWFATRRLTRPLRELQAVANALGRAEPPPRIRESGAREIREALRAFNGMQERLQRHLDGRTRALAAMSHDLRTPLTRLRLRAESIEPAPLRERFIADLQDMDALVARSLSLFQGYTDAEPLQPTDLNAWVRDLAAEYRELGREVAVSGATSAPVAVSPQALRRAVRNLVDNALRFAGQAHIEVREDASDIVIDVLDRGPGIPEEWLAEVREPFGRVDTSRNRATGGVGLGLAIAAEIAAAHGGALLLRNRAGGGLAAGIRLPRTR